MRIVTVDTIRPSIQPNVCFVQLHSAEGKVGLGESFYAASSVETYIHDELAPALLEMENPTPQRVAQAFAPYVGYQGGGVEVRANGAVDIALWDLLGQTTQQSLAELLGGPVRDSIRIYNTCAGAQYVTSTNRQTSSNWGIGAGKYEDLDAFLHRPAELARELWDEGITAMKIWPFDQAAEESKGMNIDREGLTQGIRIVEAIRAEVGTQMDIMIELHALWSRLGATKIACALTDLSPYWIEDPLRPDAVDGYAALRQDITVPIAVGETCVGRRGFKPLLEAGSADVLTIDTGWTGGITEAVKVASLADAYSVGIAPHDCTGPVSLAVAVHLVCSQPNGLIQETARSFLRTWYQDVAVGVPAPMLDTVRVPTTPGHGVRLREDLVSSGAAAMRRTEK